MGVEWGRSGGRRDRESIEGVVGMRKEEGLVYEGRKGEGNGGVCMERNCGVGWRLNLCEE